MNNNISNSTILIEDNSACLATDDSIYTPTWLPQGGFIAVILGVIVMFWGITFICEEYGVPSLRKFCERNHISEDFTGSIFIGTGLSLPVFFISLVGLFASNSAIGVGAVVGGNLFNHLFTIPCSIYVSPNRIMVLDGVTFTKEMLCYFLTCLLLIWATQNGRVGSGLRNLYEKSQWQSCLTITWFSSLILIVVYVFYCLFTAYYNPVMAALSGCCPTGANKQKLQHQIYNATPTTNDEENQNNHPPHHPTSVIDNEIAVEIAPRERSEDHHNNTNTASNTNNNTREERSEESFGYHQIYSSSDPIPQPNNDTNNSDSADLEVHHHDMIMFAYPENPLEQLFYWLVFPQKLFIYWTVPDVRQSRHEHRAMLAFLLTLAWLGIQSYILTVSLTLLGNWWNVNGAVMGLTVAAWAGNYPAHWSSLVVARKGDGDIASCNVYGSNVFNNCIGLGLPWILYSIVYGRDYTALQDQGVVLSLVLLMGVILIHYLMAACCRFVHRAWMIPVMFAMYFGVLGYLCYFLLSL